MVATVRLVVAGIILLLLARSARAAWRHRGIALAVWRRIRPRHVLGAFALLVVVLGVALTLLQLVPLTRVGAGSLIGLHGNAVFAPVEEAAIRTAPAADTGAAAGGLTGPEVAFTVGTAAFLLLLVALFPWLAYVEERTFRTGLEHAGPGREAWTALRFGLLHLVMLIPLAAALAIAVAGYAYGRIYRRAYRRAAARVEVVTTPAGPLTLPPPPERAQGEAVLESTVWHTTFNSLIALLVLLGLLAEPLLR